MPGLYTVRSNQISLDEFFVTVRPDMYNARDYGALGNGIADDTVAINNTLLDVHGVGSGTVYLPGPTHLISAPLVIYSNTTLLLSPGCTVTLAAGSNCNMLKNACTIPSRTVTDAVTTAASATVTSATANFTSADVGASVGVLGAGPNYGLSSAPCSLYGTISAVNSATSITLSVVATLSATGATLSVFPARDSNISVIGGIWQRGNADSVYQTLNGHSFLWRRIDRLYLAHSQHLSTGSQGIGGRYANAFGDCTKVVAEHLDFNVGGNALQFAGPAQYLTVKNITGTTGDDMVAFVATDGQSQAGSLLGDVNGPITDVLVENIQSSACWTSLKIAGGIGSGNVANAVSRFKAKDISGTTVQGCVNITNYAGNTTFSGEIENVNVQTGANWPLVKLAASNATEVVLRGIKWPDTATPSNGVIQITNGLTSLLIKDVEFLYSGSAGGPIVLCSSSFIRHLALDGFAAPNQPTGTVDLLRVTPNNAQISVLRITNVFKSGSAGAGNIISCTGTGYNIKAMLSDIETWAGGVFSASADSTNVLSVTLSNAQTTGTLFTLQSPATLYLSNIFHTQASGNAVYANDAAATPVRVYAENVSISAGTFLARSAAQAVSTTGVTAAADLSILTPTDQDVVNNSNGALSCGAGLCIFHTGGTGSGWKNIYSGSTY